MQSFFKEHFQFIAFQKLWDWRLEKFCMRNHSCLLDNHQRPTSLRHDHDWTRGNDELRSTQLNNSQSGNSFNSLLKSCRDYDAISGEPTEFEWNIFPRFTTLQLCGKINDLLSAMGQTPESFTGRILFMSMFNDIFCDRYDNQDEFLGNAESLWRYMKAFHLLLLPAFSLSSSCPSSWCPTTTMTPTLDDYFPLIEFGSSDRTGKPVKLSEDIRVKHAHDGTGEPVKSRTSTHIVKEQFVPAEHRDTASFDADDEFNRAIDEEDIDFNMPRVPNSIMKRSHGVNVHNLIQKIENHPQRQELQSDLQQHRPFNPFSKESQDAIKASGNTELCEILDVEPEAQCKACLAYWDAGIVC